jgi:hypothetical protein
MVSWHFGREQDRLSFEIKLRAHIQPDRRADACLSGRGEPLDGRGNVARGLHHRGAAVLSLAGKDALVISGGS